MKSRNFFFTLLSLTAMLFLSVLATTQVQAQTFSGQAVGVQSNTTERIVVPIVGTTVNVLANVRVADTGPLPPRGGTLDTGLVAAQASINTGIVGATFSTGVLNSRTTGGVVAGVPTSTSQSTVNNVNLNINGVTVTATTIQANSQCTCAGATPTCTGNVVLTNLAINGRLVTVDANGSIPANTTLLSTSVTGTVGTVSTTTTTTIIGNEQIRTANGITVNALRITTTAVATDSLTGIVTTTTSDIIIAQAHSDINCSAVVTAATVTISGRVVSPYGRGVSRARVLMTDSTGQIRGVMTNPFGYYTFNDVEVGNQYILEVKHRRYSFTQQALSLTEQTTVNFTADR